MSLHKPQAAKRTGLWIAGALGDIGTTLTVGALGIKKGLVGTTGLVCELPPLNQLNLINFSELVIGGIDIVKGDAREAAEKVSHRSRTFDGRLIDNIAEDLDQVTGNIRVAPEMLWNPCALASDHEDLSVLLARQREWIQDFKQRNDLAHVVFVDVTSSEPQVAPSDAHNTPELFAELVAKNAKKHVLPSMLYAYSALLEGCSYINFTPNTGIGIPALQLLAKDLHLPYYGNDGKTGETLIKTALAPMFACRNLEIMSWEATNMLGNNDGRTLNRPENRANKIRNKAGVLENILGYNPHGDVAINYVPSLGDWKTAWDFIHFKGFLDVPMMMQFTWQGCDSILAAPLVLDMVRLSEFAHRHHEFGPQKHLACFFKTPMEVKEMALGPQFQRLLDYAESHQSNLRMPSKAAGPAA